MGVVVVVEYYCILINIIVAAVAVVVVVVVVVEGGWMVGFSRFRRLPMDCRSWLRHGMLLGDAFRYDCNVESLAKELTETEFAKSNATALLRTARSRYANVSNK